MQLPAAFTLTLWTALALAWALSGDRFVDFAFEMPEMGLLDDVLLEVVVAADEAKAALGLPDLFGRLRETLHDVFGLG